ncbi:hypothetical protein [Pararhizobium sp.]|uniref:hypothetical protein n=1 Tax=Pararhizobium sp. TaxID=1977563 RepID=UPI003D0FD0A8
MTERSAFERLIMPAVALAVLAAMIAVVSLILVDQYARVHQVDTEREGIAEADRANTLMRIQLICADLSYPQLPVCINTELERHDEDRASDRQLEAQRDIALWTAVLAISTIVLTATGIWLLWRTLVATRLTLEEARKTTDAAREANVVLRLEQRPFVSIAHERDVHVRDYRTKKQRADTYLRYSNVGRSVAQNFGLRAALLETRSPDPQEAIDDFISELDSARLMFADTVLMPGEDYESTHGLDLPDDFAKRAAEGRLFLVYAVRYRGGAPDHWFLTLHCYRLGDRVLPTESGYHRLEVSNSTRVTRHD